MRRLGIHFLVASLRVPIVWSTVRLRSCRSVPSPSLWISSFRAFCRNLPCRKCACLYWCLMHSCNNRSPSSGSCVGFSLSASGTLSYRAFPIRWWRWGQACSACCLLGSVSARWRAVQGRSRVPPPWRAKQGDSRRWAKCYISSLDSGGWSRHKQVHVWLYPELFAFCSVVLIFKSLSLLLFGDLYIPQAVCRSL